MKDKVRELGFWQFEGGGWVKIVAANIDTVTALEMAEVLIALRRSQIAKRQEAEQ